MNREQLAAQFERERGRLRAIAYRMLGSIAEAEDAVQEAWVRLDRHDPERPEDVRGWLTVVVSRICIDMLRTVVMSIMLFSAGSNSLPASRWAPGSSVSVTADVQICR